MTEFYGVLTFYAFCDTAKNRAACVGDSDQRGGIFDRSLTCLDRLYPGKHHHHYGYPKQSVSMKSVSRMCGRGGDMAEHDVLCNCEECWWARGQKEVCGTCGCIIGEGCPYPDHDTRKKEEVCMTEIERQTLEAAVMNIPTPATTEELLQTIEASLDRWGLVFLLRHFRDVVGEEDAAHLNMMLQLTFKEGHKQARHAAVDCVNAAASENT